MTRFDFSYGYVLTPEWQNRSLPAIVITPEINYSLDIKNTGNIHYSAYIASRVDGLFYHNAPNGTSQLLMPDSVRTIDQSINSPLLPGVYKLTYTITPDQGAKKEIFLISPGARNDRQPSARSTSPKETKSEVQACYFRACRNGRLRRT